MKQSTLKVIFYVVIIPLIFSSFSGCAFSDGEPWGQAEFHLTGSFDFSERQDEQARLKTTTNYALEIDVLEVTFDSLSLAMRQGERTLSFDPSEPPVGYSLCHNGHCHSDDGRLVSYEDIAAELAGSGESGFSVHLPLEGSFVLNSIPSEFTGAWSCSDQCQLQRGHLNLVTLQVHSLTIRGRVYDRQEGDYRRLPESGIALSLTIPLNLSFERIIEGVVDRVEPVGVGIHVYFELTNKLFDSINWVDFVEDNTTELIEVPNDILGESVREKLYNNSEVTVSIQRY